MKIHGPFFFSRLSSIRLHYVVGTACVGTGRMKKPSTYTNHKIDALQAETAMNTVSSAAS